MCIVNTRPGLIYSRELRKNGEYRRIDATELSRSKLCAAIYSFASGRFVTKKKKKKKKSCSSRSNFVQVLTRANNRDILTANKKRNVNSIEFPSLSLSLRRKSERAENVSSKKKKKERKKNKRSESLSNYPGFPAPIPPRVISRANRGSYGNIGVAIQGHKRAAQRLDRGSVYPSGARSGRKTNSWS